MIVRTNTDTTVSIKSVTNAMLVKGFSPYIGDNGNWFEFDPDSNAFVDSGVGANAKEIALVGYDSTTYSGMTAILASYDIVLCKHNNQTYVYGAKKEDGYYLYAMNGDAQSYVKVSSDSTWSEGTVYAITMEL